MRNYYRKGNWPFFFVSCFVSLKFSKWINFHLLLMLLPMELKKCSVQIRMFDQQQKKTDIIIIIIIVLNTFFVKLFQPWQHFFPSIIIDHLKTDYTKYWAKWFQLDFYFWKQKNFHHTNPSSMRNIHNKVIQPVLVFVFSIYGSLMFIRLNFFFSLKFHPSTHQQFMNFLQFKFSFLIWEWWYSVQN